MIIFGIDQSLTATGVAILDATGAKIMHTETISVKDRGIPRLAAIRQRVLGLALDWSPEAVAIEGYSFGSRQSHAHSLGELGGVLKLAFADLGGPDIYQIPPTTLKKFATGKGNAPKGAVMLAVFKRFGIEAANDNEADAIALAYAVATIRCGGIAWATKEMIRCLADADAKTPMQIY